MQPKLGCGASSPSRRPSGTDIPDPKVVLDEQPINAASLGRQARHRPGPPRRCGSRPTATRPSEMQVRRARGRLGDRGRHAREGHDARRGRDPGPGATPAPPPTPARPPARRPPPRRPPTPAAPAKKSILPVGRLRRRRRGPRRSAASRASSPSATTRRSTNDCPSSTCTRAQDTERHRAATTRWAPSRRSASSSPASAARPASSSCSRSRRPRPRATAPAREHRRRRPPRAAAARTRSWASGSAGVFGTFCK